MKEDSVSYSVSNFINMLVSAFSEDSAAKESENDKLSYYSWTEEQDVLNQDKQLDRKNAARLLHMYMKCELGIKDVTDITPAYELRDLFDCRVCANHIAQVYLQGVMNAAKIGEMKIFDSNADFTEREARESIKKLSVIAK